MAREDNPSGLGHLEGGILECLWTRGPLTTPEMHEAFGRPRGLAYTTVLTVLQRLAKKGLVLRVAAGKAHVYSAAMTQDEFAGRRAETLASQVIGLGSAGVSAFLAEADRLDPTFVAAVRDQLKGRGL